MMQRQSILLFMLAVISIVISAGIECAVAQQRRLPAPEASTQDLAPVGTQWARGQFDAVGRYSIIWTGVVIGHAGGPPNMRVVSRVIAIDHVRSENEPVFVGLLEVACGSRVIKWRTIEKMDLHYLDAILTRTGNSTMFTPSPGIGSGAWQGVCGRQAARVIEFEEAVSKAAPAKTSELESILGGSIEEVPEQR